MNRIWAIYASTRADLLERTRRYQYVATIAVTLLIGTLLVPGKNAGYETFLIDGYRGIYNSPWIGATFAILATMLLSLFAFYNVKSAAERDRTTRVGEILAATPLPRFDYALGKALSNFLVLGSMAAILFVVAIAMQFVRGESAAFDLVTFVWSGDPLGDLSGFYACSRQPPSGQNVTRYCNRRVDAAMAKFATLYTFRERQPYANFIQEQLQRDAPTIVLGIPDAILAYNSDLQNFHPNDVVPFDNFMNVDI